MIKKTLCASAFLFSVNVLAQGHIDLYGDDPTHAKAILKKYGRSIEQIESAILKNMTTEPYRETMSPASEKLLTRRQALIEKIQKEYGYTFVAFDTIYYGGNQGDYTTIEVVSPKQPERMRFVETPFRPVKHQLKNDVITQMNQYAVNTMMQFAKTRKNPASGICPVFHCIGSFDTPQFKTYLKAFNDTAIKKPDFILNTIKSDPDPERRAAAVFLVGHFKNPNEIIQILLPYALDKNAGVRNNAMRVIGETMRKAKIYDIDVNPLITLLDSPYDTDRNKSLFVLSEATKSTTSKAVIKQQGFEKLLNLLALKQPNNHELAYQILKTISGKDFGEHNLTAWTKWVHSGV